ncbi:MAG: hypothetical protein J0I41_00125 [Filimonas sp.]|nr:hypothetical protein [Filimonas sp.]
MDELQKEVIVNIKTNVDDSSLKSANDNANQLKENLDGIGKNEAPKKTFNSIKQDLREANLEAQKIQQQFGRNSQQFIEAAKKVANLKDEFQEYNAAIEAFNPDNKLQAVVSLARGATGAIQGVTGAMTFLGVESEKANETIAKLQGLMAFSQALNSLDDIKNSFKNLNAVLGLTAAAEEGATVASKGLSVALKSIGIGLIIAAIAYLVSNWKELKESISNVIPGIDKAGEVFDKVKAVFIGFGSAVVKYVVAPIKAFIDIIHGDFKKAVDDMVDGLNVTKNVMDGYNNEMKKQEAEAQRKLAEERVKGLEYALKQYKEGSKEYLAVQKELDKQRLASTKDDSDERVKVVQDITTRENQNKIKAQEEADKKAKEARDKALAAAKAAHEKLVQENNAYMEKIIEIDKQADRVLLEGSESARQKELADVQSKYKEQIIIYEKKHFDISKLVEAQKTEEARINKKFDDQITQGIKDAQARNVDIYEQKKNEINKTIDQLLTSATEQQKKQLEELRKSQLQDLSDEQGLNTLNVQAQTDLTVTKNENYVTNHDTPDQRRKKIEAIYSAEHDAEQAAFELKKQQLQGNNEELQQIQADHDLKLTEMSQKLADDEKAIDDARRDAKLNNLDVLSGAVGAFGGLLEQSTVAGKALAVAQTTVDTYVGAQKAYVSQLIPGDPTSPIRATIAAGVAVVTGLANVKKILSTSVGSKGTGGGSTPNVSPVSIMTPPTIASIAPNIQNEVQSVRVVNQQDQVIKAYVTDKDIKNNSDRQTFMNNLSNF